MWWKIVEEWQEQYSWAVGMREMEERGEREKERERGGGGGGGGERERGRGGEREFIKFFSLTIIIM